MYLEELHKLKVERELGHFNAAIGPISDSRIEDRIIGAFLGATVGDILGLNVFKSNAQTSFSAPFSIQIPIMLAIAESIIGKKDLHPANISSLFSSMLALDYHFSLFIL
jgi:ADP-ribosylglycohydrolase